MSFWSFFSPFNRLHLHLLSLFKGRRVGRDVFGNVYYCGKPRGSSARERRWVKYRGDSEPSYVPPVWHAWLHHQRDMVPDEKGHRNYDWQKEPIPNMTGTPMAYKPKGYPEKGGQRDRATGDYESWKP